MPFEKVIGDTVIQVWWVQVLSGSLDIPSVKQSDGLWLLHTSFDAYWPLAITPCVQELPKVATRETERPVDSSSIECKC